MDELRAQLSKALPLVLLIFVVACSDRQPRHLAAAVPASEEPFAKVDSILPTEEAMSRFLHGVVRVESLAGGAESRTELIERFFHALAARDTAALTQLLVSRSEYGYLYYPTSIYARKPYELPPDIAWMLNAEGNTKALRRLLARLGGSKLTLSRADCRTSTVSGADTFESDCRVTYRTSDGANHAGKLFNSIMQHDGRWKFLSLAGDL